MIFWGLGQFYVKQVICRWIVAPLVIIQFVLKPRPAILKATTSDMLIKTNRSDKVAVFPLNTRMCNNYRSSCHSFNDFKSAASLIINQVASVLYSYLDLRGQGSKCMDWSNKKHLSQVHTPTPSSAETCFFFFNQLHICFCTSFSSNSVWICENKLGTPAGICSQTKTFYFMKVTALTITV